MSTNEILTAIVQNVPYPEQIKDIDASQPDSIRFTWRGTRYCANINQGLDELGDGVLIGSDKAILMRTLVFPPIKPIR